MKLSFSDWEDYHHQIYRIYHGIIALSLVPFFLVFLELESVALKEPLVPVWAAWLILVLFIPAIGYTNWRIWKGDDFGVTLTEENELRQKLVAFRKVEVKRYVWMELLSLLALAGLWLTANYLFVIVYFALLAQFSFLRPSEERVARILKLTKEERSKLHKSSF